MYESADHTKEHMGLTTWKYAPNGRILKSDTPIAKNYLDEKQIRQLERTVSGYFDYIEDLIERENAFTMQEFSDSINAFLEFRKYDILKDNGKISHQKSPIYHTKPCQRCFVKSIISKFYDMFISPISDLVLAFHVQNKLFSHLIH